MNIWKNQNSPHDVIKWRLKSDNSCYYSVQVLLSSLVLSINWKFKIYRTIILPVVLYGCQTWSPAGGMELSVLKEGSWDEYLNPTGVRMGSGEGSSKRNFVFYTVHLI